MTEWEIPAGLDAALKREFGMGARALPTPALTGVRLWKLSRPEWTEHYKVLPEEIRRDLYTGQARSEWCTAPGVRSLDAIYEYDCRWAYVACCTGNVCGTLVHDRSPEWDPRARGFYRILVSPPPGWDHVGLFMVKRPGNGGWHFPTTGTHETVAGWTEVLLGMEYGWQVNILERFIWLCDAPAPLDLWRSRLLRIQEADPTLAGAVRAIIIHTIGQFHARGRDTLVTVDTPDEIPPARALTATRLEDGRWQYRTRAPLPAHLAAVMHPEWSADVYARCRTRLLRYQIKRKGAIVRETGALTVPRADVLAFRTDALWLANDPGWEDSGAIGEMRLRGVVTGPVEPPRSPLDIRDLRARMQRR